MILKSSKINHLLVFIFDVFKIVLIFFFKLINIGTLAKLRPQELEYTWKNYINILYYNVLYVTKYMHRGSALK